MTDSPVHREKFTDASLDAVALETVIYRHRLAYESWQVIYDRMEAHILVAEQRLTAARDALVATGYFTAEQVGDDIAPRITEMVTQLRHDYAICHRDAVVNAQAVGELEAVRAGLTDGNG